MVVANLYLSKEFFCWYDFFLYNFTLYYFQLWNLIIVSFCYRYLKLSLLFSILLLPDYKHILQVKIKDWLVIII